MRVNRLAAGWIVLLLSAARLEAADKTDVRVVEAVRNADKEAVSALLRQRADVNAPEADGTTALHWAVRQDDRSTVEQLIRAGSNVQAANRYGVQPLSLACVNGNAAMIETLLKAGADPNTALLEGETALMTAARVGTIAGVKMLLAHGADVNAQETFRGQTALMWAVAQRHLEVARVLIGAGADVRARSKGGFTPLLFAARSGDLDAVKALVTAGANVHDAAAGGTSVLNVAIINAHYEMAAFLLDRGANPNADSQFGTALHALVMTHAPDHGTLPQVPTGNLGSLELAKLVLAHGADPNARLTKAPPVRSFFISLVGATPLLLAARAADGEMMRLLIAHGADPLLPTPQNVTPLMVAAGVGYDDGVTPGTESQTLDAVTLLVGLGADVRAASDAGDTALHGAALRGANSAVQFLVDKGAGLDVKNNKGWMPLTVASGVVMGTNIKPQYHTADLLYRLMIERGFVVEKPPQHSVLPAERVAR